jgi:hypothetical protein
MPDAHMARQADRIEIEKLKRGRAQSSAAVKELAVEGNHFDGTLAAILEPLGRTHQTAGDRLFGYDSDDAAHAYSVNPGVIENWLDKLDVQLDKPGGTANTI